MTLSYPLNMNEPLYNEILARTADPNDREFTDATARRDYIFKNFECYNDVHCGYYSEAKNICIVIFDRTSNIDVLLEILPKDIVNLIRPMCREIYYNESIYGYCGSCDGDEVECEALYETIEEILKGLTVHIDRDEFMTYIGSFGIDCDHFQKWIESVSV